MTIDFANQDDNSLLLIHIVWNASVTFLLKINHKTILTNQKALSYLMI
jgi:hypothetical protein